MTDETKDTIAEVILYGTAALMIVLVLIAGFFAPWFTLGTVVLVCVFIAILWASARLGSRSTR